MSDREQELVAGHPPAVKAGGKRVVTKHKPHEKPDPDAYDQKYIDQLPDQPNIVSAPAMAVSGSGAKGTDLPHESAVHASSPHAKPMPKVQMSHSPNKAHHINQPR